MNSRISSCGKQAGDFLDARRLKWRRFRLRGRLRRSALLQQAGGAKPVQRALRAA